MKKLTLLLALTVFIQITAVSQGCLPDGIIFESQTEIDSFQINYPNCSEIIGSVIIHGNEISNLNGLNTITNVGGDLKVYYSDSITSLYGLHNINTVGGELSINVMSGISDLTGLDNLSYVSGKVDIGSISLQSLTGLENLDSIGGQLSIHCKSITNLNGLNNLQSIGNLLIHLNENLESLTGLNNLTAINGAVMIRYNDSLNSIAALSNITHTQGLVLEDNPILSDLTGLNNISNIDGMMYIEAMESLTDFSVFQDLMAVGLLNIHWNDSLTSLQGLDNINPASITSLNIYDNPLLSTCEVQSICEYLATPGSDVSIHGNATGCASQSEVEAKCMVKIDHQTKPNIAIYPNPAEKEIRIIDNEAIVNEIVIYNQLGQAVLHKNVLSNRVDISELDRGIYILEIISNGLKTREKLIIK